MTSATKPVVAYAQRTTPGGDDPDSYRMSIGEHLEELRLRLMLGLGGFAIACVVCFLFAEKIMVIFCRPLVVQLHSHHLDPQLIYTGISDPFMTFLKVTFIAATALAGPWLLYQVWLFVAAGLYPHERKVITKYIPLSLFLLVSGMLFVYFVVMPLCVGFFLDFSNDLPLPPWTVTPKIASQPGPLLIIPEWDGDPATPQAGQLWFNTDEEQLKFFGKDGQTRVMQFGPSNLLVPRLTISDYVDLTLTFMLTFGIAFQLPLVVLAVVRAGIVPIDFLRKQRRVVYFAMAVVSAFISPGDIVLSMLSLLIPLVFLYELGVWMAGRSLAAAAAAQAAETDKETH
ncbi:MAG TPA: twin-arginine translocase subunit TatC [Tepidisphaeraceae bacterium]|jgi:sec-independent protein translocase protein TatC|nr:twin-arginine translocase subunit TatC [Tepidisphaeraceae bacterium]